MSRTECVKKRKREGGRESARERGERGRDGKISFSFELNTIHVNFILKYSLPCDTFFIS